MTVDQPQKRLRSESGGSTGTTKENRTPTQTAAPIPKRAYEPVGAASGDGSTSGGTVAMVMPNFKLEVTPSGTGLSVLLHVEGRQYTGMLFQTGASQTGGNASNASGGALATQVGNAAAAAVASEEAEGPPGQISRQSSQRMSKVHSSASLKEKNANNGTTPNGKNASGDGTSEGTEKKARQAGEKRSRTKDVTCANCGTDTTTVWRKGPEENTRLCNGCGLYFNKTGRNRPPILWRNNSKIIEKKEGEANTGREDGTGTALTKQRSVQCAQPMGPNLSAPGQPGALMLRQMSDMGPRGHFHPAAGQHHGGMYDPNATAAAGHQGHPQMYGQQHPGMVQAYVVAQPPPPQQQQAQDVQGYPQQQQQQQQQQPQPPQPMQQQQPPMGGPVQFSAHPVLPHQHPGGPHHLMRSKSYNWPQGAYPQGQYAVQHTMQQPQQQQDPGQQHMQQQQPPPHYAGPYPLHSQQQQQQQQQQQPMQHLQQMPPQQQHQQEQQPQQQGEQQQQQQQQQQYRDGQQAPPGPPPPAPANDPNASVPSEEAGKLKKTSSVRAEDATLLRRSSAMSQDRRLGAPLRKSASTDMHTRSMSQRMAADSGLAPANSNEPRCSNCGTTETSLWRRGENSNQRLCNACGLYWQKTRKQRPAMLWKWTSQSTTSGANRDSSRSQQQTPTKDGPQKASKDLSTTSPAKDAAAAAAAAAAASEAAATAAGGQDSGTAKSTDSAGSGAVNGSAALNATEAEIQKAAAVAN
eukprot:Clim_evm12s22 gene=Clim_evmTU12s22